MNSRKLVILLASVGIIAVIVYYFTSHDSNLWSNIVASASVFLVGLAFIYLIVEWKINEEKRVRLRPVERLVLDGVLAYAISIVRITGMYAGHSELEPKPGENSTKLIEKTESFAKNVITQGLQFPQSKLQKQSAVEFIRLLDNLLDDLFSLQSRYPFVIVEYPDVATILGKLEAKRPSIKSAFYWALFGTSTNVSEYKQQVEKMLMDTIVICDELAETISKCLERIAEKDNQGES